MFFVFFFAYDGVVDFLILEVGSLMGMLRGTEECWGGGLEGAHCLFVWRGRWWEVGW